ncbi:hypothetical protein [Myceligenerans pegani]|uniref:Secreted protein n=1 Tax=Myceligenerans pegani TaxID=2776917 RepID=A0ABR9MZ04_9MICO|nr:hypothetical protein [Myceligenerans sp. TRM 65318]MBE1876628.1 hypothetical protein [Myceligenerans sp. TRM 65318]MBE3018899.1 hypothetical protein [Myceligenerans sp. TRM 65318]
MDVILGGVLAIIASLVGQAVAHRFTRRNAAAANQWAREEKLRQERVAAYSEFAGALTTYRRAMLDRAFARVKDPHDPGVEEHRRLSHRSRDTALQSLYLVELLADRQEVIEAAQAAYHSMEKFLDVQDRDEAESIRTFTRTTIRSFVGTARTTSDLGPPASTPS